MSAELLSILMFTLFVGVCVGYRLRRRDDVEPRPTSTPTPSTSPHRARLARFEIQLVGTTIKTDVIVDLEQLEAFANGFGRTLVEITSTARH